MLRENRILFARKHGITHVKRKYTRKVLHDQSETEDDDPQDIREVEQQEQEQLQTVYTAYDEEEEHYG